MLGGGDADGCRASGAGDLCTAHPVLTHWANFWRAYGTQRLLFDSAPFEAQGKQGRRAGLRSSAPREKLLRGRGFDTMAHYRDC
jgi:hypothetical protein